MGLRLACGPAAEDPHHNGLTDRRHITPRRSSHRCHLVAGASSDRPGPHLALVTTARTGQPAPSAIVTSTESPHEFIVIGLLYHSLFDPDGGSDV